MKRKLSIALTLAAVFLFALFAGPVYGGNGKGKTSGDDRKPVGLLFAGNFFVTIANPIGPVLTRFGVTIDGE